MKNIVKKHPKYSVAVLLLFVAAALFLTFSDDYYKVFSENIVPELVGVAVELAIIIFVFDWIAQRQEKRKAREMEKRAREYLRFIVVNIMKSERLFEQLMVEYPKARAYQLDRKKFQFFAKDRVESSTLIDHLINVLKSNDTEAVASHIKLHLKHDLASFHSFAPVVAQISEKHMKIWGRIIFFITKTVDSDDTINNVIEVLEKIKKFDEQTEVEFKI
ncbi:hypothetical protein P3526_10980 [Vibrio parahaemolyticus]|uniref:hypothetical protein n=1 Tax=Vibrio parahaemolyticus TaxID=670 RepID=UPI0004213BA3|nr:hypothetical protein [Vibrio parahaemolyticus]EGR1752922.1 hypothetical protein [Vibrio parahaemolyticus]EME0905699.1 hypothetical protein [Vibrio parahaemolyticus]MDF4664824.1 hypothetical protein [Vibrio parahaemolyticus]HCG5564145.1 hypothetical protein [Vibrio parahaemolyticus]HCG8839015.1 hypothetical protein [Vibrio parahaemolyticus]